jgi:hypothetical protein
VEISLDVCDQDPTAGLQGVRGEWKTGREHLLLFCVEMDFRGFRCQTPLFPGKPRGFP